MGFRYRTNRDNWKHRVLSSAGKRVALTVPIPDGRDQLPAGEDGVLLRSIGKSGGRDLRCEGGNLS